MRDLPATDPLVDDIASLIDEALTDPARADLVQAAMRTRLARLPPAAEADDPDAEDLWDNVPL
jgi:hypothetical protein